MINPVNRGQQGNEVDEKSFSTPKTVTQKRLRKPVSLEPRGAWDTQVETSERKIRDDHVKVNWKFDQTKTCGDSDD